MSRITLYRNSAQDCMERARTAASAEDRARWLARAQLWLQKAQEAERSVEQEQPDKPA
jgi:hypothetical protein